MATVAVERFAKMLELEVLCQGAGTIEVAEQNVNRPGLQLAGFFEHFKSERLQVLGTSEMEYFDSLPHERQVHVLTRFMSYPLSGVVICRGMHVPQLMLELAAENNIPLFSTTQDTSDFITRTKHYFSMLLAPRVQMHGVLVDVLGFGLLITGDSGMGKSETALELVRHGHKLVADDAVDIVRLDDRLVGSSPETIRYFMEIRGLGIIDVRQMFGVSSVLPSKTISAVVSLQPWEEVKAQGFDRIDTKKYYTDILGIDVRKIVIPVAPGRNIASIVEIAAQNMRLDAMGYNVMDELDARLMQAARTNEMNL